MSQPWLIHFSYILKFRSKVSIKLCRNKHTSYTQPPIFGHFSRGKFGRFCRCKSVCFCSVEKVDFSFRGWKASLFPALKPGLPLDGIVFSRLSCRRITKMRPPFDGDCSSGRSCPGKAVFPRTRNLRFKARKMSRSTPYPRQTEIRVWDVKESV